MQTLSLEAAPSSILHRLTCSAKTPMTLFCRSSVSRKDLLFPPSTSSCLPLSASLRRNFRSGFAAFCSPSEQEQSPPLALFLEVEGVLMDAYRLCNRQAFNKAFQKLGLDCANWTEPIYLDLSRKSGGDEEKMLFLFFNRIGWPTSLPTNEKDSFVKRVLEKKKIAIDELILSEDLPLRPGVEEFIDDAHEGGIPVIMLTAYSRSGEKVARSIVEKLGQERLSNIKIIGTHEVGQSLYGQLVLGGLVPSGVDDQLAKEVRKAASAEKQRIAEEVASVLKLSVELDSNISSESLEKIVAALRAGAEAVGAPLDSCILVAGSQSGVAGAQQAGMACVVLRSSSTARAEFPSAKAVMDGFGGADLTVSKLRRIRWS